MLLSEVVDVLCVYVLLLLVLRVEYNKYDVFLFTKGGWVKGWTDWSVFRNVLSFQLDPAKKG